jgi:hypothetical protein
MSRLSAHLDRVRAADAERGAVTTLVAALLAVGLLLGMGALVIDSGQLFGERAELQSGADAAALAIAQTCAGPDGCMLDPYGTAVRYAGANANDGTAAVPGVCGRDTAARLAACPVSSGCFSSVPATGNFVEVRAATRRPDGSTVLPPVFGRILLGESYDGRGVLACARVAWGGPRAATGLGMTMSLCEWQAATSGGTVFAPAPPATVPGSAERVLRLHGTGNACAGGPSGWDLPGGFGWLEDTTGHCETQVDVTGTYRDNTGVAASHACEIALAQAVANSTVALVPVYDGAGGTGNTGFYHLRGFASFVITGYALPGKAQQSVLTGAKPCKGDDKCVYGYFTRDLVTTATAIGGPELGSTAVQVIG